MTADPAFEDWIAHARAVDLVATAENLLPSGSKLSRGHERAGPCPIEGVGRDRFAVSMRKNIWSCRGCGTGGDVIKLMQMAKGVDFVQACEILTGSLPPRGQAMTAAERADIERRQAEREAEAERKRAQQAEASARYREEERARLYEIWRHGRGVMGTPAGDYLAARGIPQIPSAAKLRHHGAMRYYRPEDPWDRPFYTGPALIAAITGPDGTFRGLHATWVEKKGGVWVKFDPGLDARGEPLPAKKVRGSKKGNHIDLRAPAEPTRMFIGEGIETALSAWHSLAASKRLEAGDLFRSAIDLGNLAGAATESVAHPTERKVDAKGRHCTVKVPGPIPDLNSQAFVVPAGVQEVVLLGDGDSEAFATQMALHRAARRIAALYPWVRKVRLSMADDGVDFNDMVRGAA